MYMNVIRGPKLRKMCMQHLAVIVLKSVISKDKFYIQGTQNYGNKITENNLTLIMSFFKGSSAKTSILSQKLYMQLLWTYTIVKKAVFN